MHARCGVHIHTRSTASRTTTNNHQPTTNNGFEQVCARDEHRPLPLIKDGDPVVLIKDMLAVYSHHRVKGDAVDQLVRIGAVEHIDVYGNDQADSAADLGRRHVDACVIDRRRGISQACHTWYPIVYDIHRFFISVARVVVNNDDKRWFCS